MTASLPSTWVAVPLSAVCEINPRTKSELKADDLVSFVPMAAVSEHSGTIVASETRPLEEVRKGFTPFQDGDVLFAKITPCMENGKAAIARRLVNGQGYGSTEFHVLRPSSLVMAEWLFAIIRTAEFRRAAAASFQGAVGQQRVTVDFLQRFRIPLPPLSEQQRIVDILQEAEEIRRLRAQAEAKTAELIPALFHQTFLAHPERTKWSETTINKVAADEDNSIRTGPFGSDLLHSEFVDSGIPVLGIDNVVSNRFRWDERRYITQSKYEGMTRFRVYPDDVMVTIMGTVGRCAIAPADLPEAISTKHLCVITPDKSKVLPTFLWASILSDPTIRAQTKAVGKGAIMEGWNSKIIRALKFRLPPLDLQRVFEKQVNEILALEECGEPSDTIAKSLTASLFAHAFTGQLTEDWRESNNSLVATEARERDIALGTVDRNVITMAAHYNFASRASGRATVLREALSRSQQQVLTAIEKHFAPGRPGTPYWFTAEALSRIAGGCWTGDTKTAQSLLAVLVARGFVLSVSREQIDERTEVVVFGTAYRLPMNRYEPEPDGEGEPFPGDFARQSEMWRLAERLTKMRMLP